MPIANNSQHKVNGGSGVLSPATRLRNYQHNKGIEEDKPAFDLVGPAVDEEKCGNLENTLESMRYSLQELSGLVGRSKAPSRNSSTPCEPLAYPTSSHTPTPQPHSHTPVPHAAAAQSVTSGSSPVPSHTPTPCGGNSSHDCPKCRSQMELSPKKSLTCSCPSCKSDFNFVLCPYCNKSNFWPLGTFIQGADSQCGYCSKRFALVQCPNCSAPYMSEKFYQGVKTTCVSCSFDFSMVLCPKCRNPNFWHSKDYKQGAKSSCGLCNNVFAMMLCKGCQSATFWARPITETAEVYCDTCKASRTASRETPLLGKEVDAVRSVTPQLRSAPRARLCQKNVCQAFVDSLQLHAVYFDATHDVCYCNQCMAPGSTPSTCKQVLEYTIPLQWTRVGLKVDPVRVAVDDVWRSWCVTFHGTGVKALERILYHRQLLPFADTDIHSVTDIISSTAVNDAARHSIPKTFVYEGVPYTIEIVLQCFQRPNSFRMVSKEDRVELVSHPCVSSVIPYGLLLRATPSE